MSATHAIAQLRHLYAQMIEGHVRDTGAAARGLLGPAIAELERFMDARASPAPETRTADTCSGCGKSISGPRFCLSCLERVDVTIGAPETRTGEGAAPCGGSRCYLNDDETLWIHSSKSYSSCAVHRQAGDTNLKFTAARAPSPRDGGQP